MFNFCRLYQFSKTIESAQTPISSIGISIPLYSDCYLKLSLLNFNHSGGCVLVSHCGLNLIFLIINELKAFFYEYQFRSIAIFSTGLPVFFLLICRSYYILNTFFLYCICHGHVLSSLVQIWMSKHAYSTFTLILIGNQMPNISIPLLFIVN